MESTVPRYRRVVVKLSGEALAGSGSSGVDPASLSRVAEEVLSVHDLGVQVAVVVGGGNYFRGRGAEGWGISRAEADNIGMLGTVMNALMLRGVLTAGTGTDVRVLAHLCRGAGRPGPGHGHQRVRTGQRAGPRHARLRRGRRRRDAAHLRGR